MGTPFKMKGSPMQRNFGIGLPTKKSPVPQKKTDVNKIDFSKNSNLEVAQHAHDNFSKIENKVKSYLGKDWDTTDIDAKKELMAAFKEFPENKGANDSLTSSMSEINRRLGR